MLEMRGTGREKTFVRPLLKQDLQMSCSWTTMTEFTLMVRLAFSVFSVQYTFDIAYKCKFSSYSRRGYVSVTILWLQ